MPISLRQELDQVTETEAMEEIEVAFEANHEVSCGLGNCEFKLTDKDLKKTYKGNVMNCSSDLWDHRYSHVRRYNVRRKK